MFRSTVNKEEEKNTVKQPTLSEYPFTYKHF